MSLRGEKVRSCFFLCILWRVHCLTTPTVLNITSLGPKVAIGHPVRSKAPRWPFGRKTLLLQTASPGTKDAPRYPRKKRIPRYSNHLQPFNQWIQWAHLDFWKNRQKNTKITWNNYSNYTQTKQIRGGRSLPQASQSTQHTSTFLRSVVDIAEVGLALADSGQTAVERRPAAIRNHLCQAWPWLFDGKIGKPGLFHDFYQQKIKESQLQMLMKSGILLDSGSIPSEALEVLNWMNMLTPSGISWSHNCGSMTCIGFGWEMVRDPWDNSMCCILFCRVSFCKILYIIIYSKPNTWHMLNYKCVSLKIGVP